MKYFRSYPWGFQLLMFLLMTFTFLSCASAIILSVFTRLTGMLPAQLAGITPASPAQTISAAVTVQGIESIFIFLLPALVFAYLCTPRPMEYLGMRAPGNGKQVLLVILLILGAMPVLEAIQALMSKIDFGKSVKAAQAANDNMMEAFLHMPTFAAFIKGFLVMAIIPAVGEELFFRGVLMRFAKKRSSNMLFPILFTAAVFSYSHTNVYGYVSIFMAGILLAVIYYLTGSLWCSIIAHLVFNGSQVVLAYMSSSNAALKAAEQNTSIPYYLVIGGVILFGVSLYALIRNATPLPPNWSDDFTRPELEYYKEQKKNGKDRSLF